MPHAHHQRENRLVLQFIENPVIINAYAISRPTALEVLHRPALDHAEPLDSEGETWEAIVGYRYAMT